MTLRLLYIIPMILGRTYDARTNTIGIDIFPKEALDALKIIPETQYGSLYKTVESSSDVKDVLGIQGDLSLKIKGNTFDIKGLGTYLKETLNKANTVETLIKVSFRTYSLTLPSSAMPVPFWKTMSPEFLGTHFVQSVTYGGDLIASVSFKAVKSEYLQEIRGAVKASLEVGSALQLVAEGQLEMLEKKLKGLANIEVSYFATVPLEGVANSIEGLSELVKNFQSHVKKVNDGWGVPTEVDLGDLSTFDSRLQYLKDSLLESELTAFEELLDDLTSSKMRLREWSSSLPILLPKDIEETIENLRGRISKTLRVFYETISNLDMSGGVEQLQPSVLAYEKNGKSRLPGKFKRELDKLIKKTEIESEKAPSWGSSTYTRYGKKRCGSKQSETVEVYSGYLASSPDDTEGAGVNYLCLPRTPQKPKDGDSNQILDASPIQGVRFGLLEDGIFENEDAIILKGVLCSVCLTEERTTVVMFADTIQCPEDGNWITEYSGFLMSSNSVNRAQHICLDRSPDFREGEGAKSDQTLNVVKVLSDEEMDGKVARRAVPCVVCSK